MQSLSHTLKSASLAGAILLASAAPSLSQGNAPPVPGSELSNAEVQDLSRQILQLGTLERNGVMARLVDRGNTDVVPALIQSLRFLGQDPWSIVDALKILTGEDHGNRWNDWMLWQEARPDIIPFEGFDEYKSWVYSHIDPNLGAFLYAGIPHTIRLEEISWGGVIKDGIPALVNPKLVPPAEADYITPDELVFGVEINGDTRAYPLRMLDWHEMFNDVIGGVPVALAYCTLCGSGILFETDVAGRDAPFEFGSSGFLYRSNKLMFDRETDTLWNQFTGKPVAGKLVGSDIALKVRPVAITSWAKWYARHPDTTVLSLDTGFDRDYTPGKPYAPYFDSPDLMFPARVNDTRLAAKDYVYALRMGDAEKAWALKLFEDTPVLNDTIDGRPIVLVGDSGSRTVRAYETGGREFSPAAGDAENLVAMDGSWRITEAELISGSGETLSRLPGHIAYWFAWQNFRPSAETRFE
ncbi:MAG: DUF3179 domain-containing protein [Rhodospirillaceae bacterium]|jgi:hypothetical protein|nr:DUF3179 domain-containing protein [Rhodospirillaceae bacterium]MBT5357064.1 DUF3179 domain-containing protein [Rhodospirillaceae bacterium]MBT5769234.1 DUF3179 domain-containing protein [Rhodospirillaceae bacterium]MBT6308832.1 DUF3179 domain-containing protein [Rhodospirillaceae bacterium]MBT7366538.1 DUF3179 domain-containing protein [Rhodospirillaceae bacterium]